MLFLRHWGQKSFPLQHGSHPRHPPFPTEVRDQHGYQRDDRAESRKQIKDVPLRIAAALLDETHVVEEQKTSDRVSLRFNGGRSHVQRPAGQLQHGKRIGH